MATAVAALEDCSLMSITAGGARVVAREATSERLQEFDDIVSRGLPRFRRIAMRWLNNGWASKGMRLLATGLRRLLGVACAAGGDYRNTILMR